MKFITDSRVRFALLALVVAVAIAFGVRRLSNALDLRNVQAHAPASLAFSPSLVDLQDGEFVEGMSIKRTLDLLNVSGEPVRLLGVESSCSCTLVLAREALTFPHILPPHSKLPVEVRLDTAEKAGKQRYSISAFYADRGAEKREAVAYVEVLVRSALRPYPPVMRFDRAHPRATQSGSVYLADMQTSSDLKIVGVKAVGLADVICSVDPSDAPVSNLGVKLSTRYKLEVRFPAPADQPTFTGLVSVELSNGKSINVPIQGSLDQPYHFIPSRLFMTRADDQGVVERTIFCVFATPAAARVEVLGQSEGVEILPLPALGNRIPIRVRFHPGALRADLSLKLALGDEKKPVSFEVVVR